MFRRLGSVLQAIWRVLGELLPPTYLADNPAHDQVVLPVDVRKVFSKEAEEVAERLLEELLGPAYTQLTLQGYVEIPSSLDPDIVYRLRRQQPIEVYKRGRRERHRLCVIPSEPLPAADELLVKLLWLQTNEKRVLATANRL